MGQERCVMCVLDTRADPLVFAADPTGPGPCTRVLTGLSALLVLLTLPWSLALCIKVVTHYVRNTCENTTYTRPQGDIFIY